MSDKSEVTEGKTSTKMSSRKFIVWVVTTLICIAILILNFIKDIDSEVIIKDLELYTVISGLYLGANVGSKFADMLGNKSEGDSEQ